MSRETIKEILQSTLQLISSAAIRGEWEGGFWNRGVKDYCKPSYLRKKLNIVGASEKILEEALELIFEAINLGINSQSGTKNITCAVKFAAQYPFTIKQITDLEDLSLSRPVVEEFVKLGVISKNKGKEILRSQEEDTKIKIRLEITEALAFLEESLALQQEKPGLDQNAVANKYTALSNLETYFYNIYFSRTDKENEINFHEAARQGSMAIYS